MRRTVDRLEGPDMEFVADVTVVTKLISCGH